MSTNLSTFHRGLIIAGGFFLLAVAAVRALDYNADGIEDGYEAERGMWTNAGPNNIAWFQMDDLSQTNVVDRSGNELTGTLNGFGPNAFGPGLFGTALNFAPSSFVSFAPSNDVLNISSFTVSVWLNATNATRKTSIAWWNDVDLNSWELLVATNGLGQLQFTDAQGNVQTVSGTTALDDNAWHHLAGAFEVGVSNSTATLFLDGIAEGTTTISNWTPSVHALFELGSSGGVVNGPFNLDEVRLYGAALSSSDILQLPATYSDLLGDGKTSLERYQEFLDSIDPKTEERSHSEASKAVNGEGEIGHITAIPNSSVSSGNGTPALDKATAGNLNVFTRLE